MSRAVRLAVAVATVALLTTSALSSGSTATAGTGDPADSSASDERAAARLKVAITLTPSASVVQGSAVKVTGTTSYWRTPVLLQRQKGARWVKVANGRSNQNARYSFTVPTNKVGQQAYRVRARFDGVRRPVLSRTVTLTVGGPLERPLVLHNSGSNGGVATELLGLRRWTPYVPGGIVESSPSGRVLYSPTNSPNALWAAGPGMTDVPLTKAPCVMGESISADGRYVTYGAGTVDGFMCYPPTALTLHDLDTGTTRQIAVPKANQGFSMLGTPEYTADGRFVFVTGGSGGGAMAMYDVTTGAAQRLPEVWSGDGDPYAAALLEPTTVPALPGELVVRAVSSSWVLDDCGSGMYAVVYGSNQEPTCWNGSGFSYAEASTMSASPDASTLAWVRSVAGVNRYATAPTTDPAAVTVLGPIDHAGDRGLHLFWRTNRYLQTRDYISGGESTLDLQTGSIWHGAPHGSFVE